MKYYHYIPFAFTYCLVKMLEFCSDDPDPKVRWKVYFSNGCTKENFCRFIDDMKNNDLHTYSIMIAGPNIVGCTLILIILTILFIGIFK